MTARRKSSVPVGRIVVGIAIVALLAGMAVDTKVVAIGSDADVRAEVFSPDAFGAEKFPTIKAAVAQKAVDAGTFAPEVLADKKAAGAKYGTPGTPGPVIPVKFSGVVQPDPKAGIYAVAVDGVPPEVKVRMQTGPAINGTELRDFPGDIAFGGFKNQIEFQNAGSGINNQMKKDVLASVDTKALAGKTVNVVGVFRLVNEKNWLVTPVELTVQ